MKVLIVEDDPGMVKVLKALLAPLTTEIIVAHTMAEAIDAVAQAKEIELITLDLGLPDSNIKQTIGRIRTFRDKHPNALLIVITGMNIPDLEKLVAEQGADGLVFKSDDVTFTPAGFLSFLGAVASKLITQPGRYHDSLASLEKVAQAVHQMQETRGGAR